jgi:glutathione peroxidase
MHGELKEKGFSVLGFPCNDFGGQEPGTPAEIQNFCTTKYKVTFPLFEKVGIKKDTSPVYANLIAQSKETPGWNFCKYLVGKNGKVVKFYKSGVKPEDATLRADIEAALKQ